MTTVLNSLMTLCSVERISQTHIDKSMGGFIFCLKVLRSYLSLFKRTFA